MLRTMNRVLLFSSFLICFLLLTPAVWAQYGASIQGTVQDKSGAAVVGAKVSVTNQATGATRETERPGQHLFVQRLTARTSHSAPS